VELLALKNLAAAGRGSQARLALEEGKELNKLSSQEY
jgi:hypothetical protein